MQDDGLPLQIKDRRAEVHAWRAWAAASRVVVSAMEGSLSEPERIRAAKFLHDADRSRYVFGRGMLRQILAAYLDARAEDVTFSANEFGKPFLDEPFASSRIDFNLSHSKNLIVV